MTDKAQGASAPRFTPGPWENSGRGDVVSPDGRKVVVKGLSVSHIMHGGDYPEEEANATLMLSAPDLYEALQNLRDWVVHEVGAELPFDDCDTALAKARGEA